MRLLKEHLVQQKGNNFQGSLITLNKILLQINTDRHSIYVIIRLGNVTNVKKNSFCYIQDSNGPKAYQELSRKTVVNITV